MRVLVAAVRDLARNLQEEGLPAARARVTVVVGIGQLRRTGDGKVRVDNLDVPAVDVPADLRGREGAGWSGALVEKELLVLIGPAGKEGAVDADVGSCVGGGVLGVVGGVEGGDGVSFPEGAIVPVDEV